MEIGIQQGLGKWVVADFGYFNKHTDNGYDFGVLFNTPIVFPVSWDHSRIDGFTGRVNLVEHGGFSAFVVMAHTNAIFSPPGNGGILLEAAGRRLPDRPRSEIQLDDQPAVHLRQAHRRLGGAQLAVRLGPRGRIGRQPRRRAGADRRPAGGDRLLLRQHVGDARRADHELRVRRSGATRLRIPAEGTEDDVTNPPRIAPRHLFDLGLGVDNLFHSDKAKVRLRFSVINLTNKEALYNFLSTFSGTHFVTPRAYQVHVGVSF